MISALVYKEFREALPIAGLGMAALLVIALDAMGYSVAPSSFGPRSQGAIPFLYDSMVARFGMIAAALALALGFWQSLGDFWGSAQLFVLHRPVPRHVVYSVKLAVGLAVYFACTFVPLAIYTWWAATPGTHASPFDWSMTATVGGTLLTMTAIYLGAFLSGIRPAAWMGTRLAPLAAAGLTSVVAFTSQSYWWVGTLQMLVGEIALIAAILHVAASRDFA